MSRLIEPVTGVAATQHGLLLSALADPRAGHGVDQVILEFDEVFQPGPFAEALRATVARHDGLRTGFTRHRAGYSEHVGEGAPDVSIHDRRGMVPEAIEADWTVFVADERRRGFDPSRPPLLRCACFLLPGEAGRVLLTYHHLVMDGVARDAVIAELTGRYDALRAGGDYAARLATATFSPAPCDAQAAAAYWRGALAGLGSDSPLAPMRAAGSPDPSVQATLTRVLDPHAAEALRVTAARAGCAPATLVYAAWALCLARVSGEDDVAFLAIRNARAGSRAALRAVASLVHSAPLRVRIDRAAPVAVLARAVDGAWSGSAPHADVPLADIKAWGGCGARVWDCNILFHHGRVADAFARSAPDGGARRMATLGFSDVPLTVAVMRGSTLDVHMRYWVEAFRPGAVDSLADSFLTILEAIARDAQAAVADLPWLSPAQRARIDVGATGPADPGEALLHGAFEGWARRGPERIALEWEGGALSYGALDMAANALAAILVKGGVGAEEPVAVLAERSAFHLVAVLAVLKAGAAFLPLDPAHPDAHLAAIVAGAGTTRCIASPMFAGRARGLGVGVVVAALDQRSSTRPSPAPSPAGLAYMIATSGTTGEPKIVEVEHRAAANTLTHSLRSVYAPGDLALVPWTDSPAADASIHQIFAPLGAGGTLVVASGLDTLKASPRFGDFTAFGATPSMLAALLSSSSLPPNLRTVMFGGEACPQALADLLRETTGIRRAVNVYGPTEAAIYCTAHDVMTSGAGQDGGIGRPIANIRAELFDERGEPVIPGAVGELCIAGAGLARGYRGRNSDSFVERTGADGKMRRYYRSGDMAALLPEGTLEFHGRRDRQAKVRGVRIELDAVERAIEALPGVSRALADTRTDGRGARHLVAWVVTESGVDQLRGALRDAVPAAMLPSVLAPIGQVPLTAAGKPDYSALPMPDAGEPVRSFAGFADQLERLVAAEWRGLLGHDRFGRDDDFFDAGGDSLKGMELLLRLGEVFGTRVSAVDLDGGWTVAAMARASLSAAPVDSFMISGEGLPGRPIFWIMPSLVNLTMFDGMTPPQPIYMETTDRLERTGESFGEFGAWMAGRIRAAQPHGPYLLGGFCLGACAAFETAVALTSMGETVDRVSLVDRTVPAAWENALRQARFALIGDSTLSWRRRGALMRVFRPSAPLDVPVSLMLTRHSAWKPGAFRRWGGWREWVLGELRIARHPATLDQQGVRRAVMALADTTG